MAHRPCPHRQQHSKQDLGLAASVFAGAAGCFAAAPLGFSSCIPHSVILHPADAALQHHR